MVKFIDVILSASAVMAAVLPSLNSLPKRTLLGPIATDSAASIAGGEIACGSPPVSSFFADLNPPVSQDARGKRQWSMISVLIRF